MSECDAPKRKIDWKACLKLTGYLLLLTVVVTVVVTLFYLITHGTADARREAARTAAWETVLPDAQYFSETRYDRETVDTVMAGFENLRLVGYCVEVTTRGFSGPITLTVGVDENGAVTGVVILKQTETQEKGASADDPAFLGQFVGKSGTVRVNAGSNAVDGVSGATETSKAITAGVNAALSAVADLAQEGGGSDEEGEN